VSGNPLLGFQRDVHEGLKVVKTEGRPIAPSAIRILERPREGCCEERTLLTDILPDCSLDVAASQRVSRFLVVGSHLVSSLKVALSQGEESQRTFLRRKHETEAVDRGPERNEQRE